MRTHRDLWLAATLAAASLIAWVALCRPRSDPAPTDPSPGAGAASVDVPWADARDAGDPIERSLALAEIEQALVEAEPTAAMLETARRALAGSDR